MNWSLSVTEWEKWSDFGCVPDLTDSGLGDIAEMLRKTQDYPQISGHSSVDCKPREAKVFVTESLCVLGSKHHQTSVLSLFNVKRLLDIQALMSARQAVSMLTEVRIYGQVDLRIICIKMKEMSKLRTFRFWQTKTVHVGSVTHVCMLPLSVCGTIKLAFFGVNTARVDSQKRVVSCSECIMSSVHLSTLAKLPPVLRCLGRWNLLPVFRKGQNFLTGYY